MNSSLVRFAAAAAFAASAFSASALTITNNASVAAGPVLLGASFTPAIPQFDSTLGTLNSVTIKYTGHASVSFSLKNNDSTSRSGDISAYAEANTVSGPNYSFLGFGPTNTVNVSVNVGETIVTNVIASDLSNQAVLTSNTDKAPYIGLSTVPFTVTAYSRSLYTFGSEVTASPTPTASAELTVIYDYTPNQECTPQGVTTIKCYTLPENWPAGVTSITVGCKTYTKAEAIRILKNCSDDKKGYWVLQQLIAAVLNTDPSWCNDTTCVREAIAAADAWLCQNLNTKSCGGDRNSWNQIKAIYCILGDYNNGRLCAPLRALQCCGKTYKKEDCKRDDKDKCDKDGRYRDCDSRD